LNPHAETANIKIPSTGGMRIDRTCDHQILGYPDDWLT
jgi:hypothetical protein